MSIHRLSRASLARFLTLSIIAVFALSACRALPVGLFSSGDDQTPAPSPTPITKTMCESGADLAVDVGFLQRLDVSEDGVVPLIAAVDLALGEAQTLGTLVVEEYQPLVNDVIVSLQDLRDISEELESQETIGGGITAIGESLVGIGESMEALEQQLREPCPEEEA